MIHSLFCGRTGTVIIAHLDTIHTVILVADIISIAVNGLCKISVFLFIFISDKFMRIFCIRFFFINRSSQHISKCIIGKSVGKSIMADGRKSVIFVGIRIGHCFLCISNCYFLAYCTETLCGIVSVGNLISSSICK